MQDIVCKYHNDFNKIKLPNFTELEQNLLFTLITRIRTSKPEYWNDTHTFYFGFGDISEMFSKEYRHNHNEIEHICASLKHKFFKADFTILCRETLKINNQEKEVLAERTINLFTEFALLYVPENLYDSGNKKEFYGISLTINPRFEYLINQLINNFTRFELAEFIALSGKYTKTLYRQLKQFRQTGSRIFKWDEFLEIMDIPDSYRQIDIDQQILKPALRELTAERNLFDTKRIPFKDLKYTKLDKNQQPNPRGRNKVCFIKFEWEKEKVQEELEAESRERIAENLKNHIPTSDDYNAKQEFENYKGVEVSFYDSNNRLRIAEIKDFDNETNQLLCYDKKVNQNFYIPFENLQKANTWIAEKLKGIY